MNDMDIPQYVSNNNFDNEKVDEEYARFIDKYFDNYHIDTHIDHHSTQRNKEPRYSFNTVVPFNSSDDTPSDTFLR